MADRCLDPFAELRSLAANNPCQARIRCRMFRRSGLANGSVRCVVTLQPTGTSGEEDLRGTPANGRPCLGPVVELMSSADRNAMRN